MLFMLGALQLDVRAFNPQRTTRDAGGEYVEKPVLGVRPPLEHVGEATETLSIEARIHPHKLGGMGGLSLLDQMRQSGVSQYVMRGDGTPIGWCVVEKVSESGSYLDALGVGRVIEVQITLKRADAPQGSNYVAALMGLFQ